MPTALERVIFGSGKNIGFDKFNIGSLTKSVAFDLQEFGERGVQGVKIQESDSKFEGTAVVVKNYKNLRETLAKSSAAVTNLDGDDPVIKPASEKQGRKFGTEVTDEDNASYGGITGNIILCAHGRPAVVPSGRVIGDQFGKKTPKRL